MYARTTTIQATPDRLDAGIASVEQLRPEVEAIPGHAGLSLLVDRASGRVVLVSAWQSREAMLASAEQVRPLRDAVASSLGGSAEVAEWELAHAHGVRDATAGSWARVVTCRGDEVALDRLLDASRDIRTSLDELPGFCSYTVLMHRQGGRALGLISYVDRDAIEQSRAGAGRLRDSVAGASGVEFTDVSELEYAVARLRVPETV